MKSYYWAGLLVALLVVVAFLLSAQRRARRDADTARLERTEARLAAERYQSQYKAAIADLSANKAQVAMLQEQHNTLSKAQREMESELRNSLKSKDVTISELQGKLTVNILDRVLFNSGDSKLKPEGEAVLKKIAAVLANHPNRQILVIGHTDNVPIRFNRQKYASNWELSTTRSTSAVRFLTETGGVSAKRLAAVGYGEHHPLADNATPEGRAQNRRIAVVILAEDLLAPAVDEAHLPEPLPPADAAERVPASLEPVVPPAPAN